MYQLIEVISRYLVPCISLLHYYIKKVQLYLYHMTVQVKVGHHSGEMK